MNPNLALMTAQQQERLIDARASRIVRQDAPSTRTHRPVVYLLAGRRGRSAASTRNRG